MYFSANFLIKSNKYKKCRAQYSYITQ